MFKLRECCSLMGEWAKEEIAVIDVYDHSPAIRVTGGFLIPLKYCPNCGCGVICLGPFVV